MIIQTTNLSKIFHQGSSQINAVDSVSLEVKKGETVSIVGKSGSGKTTLLSLLTGLESSSDGNIIINNINITKLNEKKLAQFRSKEIGIVFQQFHLLQHLTALENVSLALEISGSDDIDNLAKKALDQVGLKDRYHHQPKELSGGENQRVAIARAIVNKPNLLFADEPSGNLDSKTGKMVMDLIFNLCKENNMTLILVTHDNQLAELCDRKFKLENGKII